MKTIILTGYKGSFPFVDELVENTRNHQGNIEVLDLLDMNTISFCQPVKAVKSHISPVFSRVFRIRKIGVILKIIFYKFILKRYLKECTHINIHYALPYYSHFVPVFKRLGIPVSVVVWGSDFYRAKSADRDAMRPLFDYADKIVFGTEDMASDFTSSYGGYTEKIAVIGFGVNKLDLIKSIPSNELKGLRKKLSIPEDKIVITCGYNGTKGQQHELIIEALSQLPETDKARIFISIPFGYGGDLVYKATLRDKLVSSGMPFKIFDTFLSDQEVCTIRLSSGITINAQISDARSASLLEHLYSGNILLAGEWLPYGFYRRKGVAFWSFEKGSLKTVITEVLTNLPYYKSAVVSNPEKVYEIASWSNRMPEWVSLFNNAYDRNS